VTKSSLGRQLKFREDRDTVQGVSVHHGLADYMQIVLRSTEVTR
jgi:hypothetical protein